MADCMMPGATLYAGRIAHVRHSPFRYRFDYRLWMLCIDLDCIDAVAAASKVFAHNRFGLTAINDKDHGFRDGSKLRAYAEAALAREGLGQFGAKILFMATPSVLGYAFNPISFYFCYDVAGRLGAILHQVKNTFGDQIGYLMPVALEGSVIRQAVQKRMHVSPFFDMEGGYRFALTPPAKKFTVSIQYGAEVKRLTATMQLQSRPFSDRALLRLLLQMPLTPMKVMAAIHWQALKLFLRGARFHAAPAEKHLTIVAGTPE